MSGAEPCTASARAIPPSPILQLQKNSNPVRRTECIILEMNEDI
jgi:hypothetical protein